MRWADATSYSQNKPRVQHAWRSVLTRDIAITVLDSHLYHPGVWVMHCSPWFDTYPLPDAKSPEDAQRMAIQKVRAKIDELYAAIAEI